MEFQVLGGLAVWDGAERVKVNGRLHPKILAGLLLNTGRTVSLPWLVDLLWDDEPPATARRQAQNAVAALRRQLAPIGGDVSAHGAIERVGDGYRLDVADDALDLRRFEVKARSARRRAESGDTEAALRGFEDALGLWRGPALDGLQGRILKAAAARLNDAYVSIYEECAAAALSLARPERVIDTLRELAAVHPLRQRLAARLMHALHQSGRTADALRHFDSVRQRLAEELGIDPGQELTDLRVRLLQDDPALLPETGRPAVVADTPPATALPRPATPSQLPADMSTFTGRTDQLAALDRLRSGGAMAGIVSTIAGIGGVGKTALAIHWGHTRRDEFPDGQLYINLRGFDERQPLSAHETITRLLRPLGYSAQDVPSDLDEAAVLYRSLLADKRMLVVLDNARTPEQVRPLLPASPGCLALVTSRNRMSGLIASHDAYPVHLDILNLDECVDLLVNLLGSTALADIEAVRQLSDLCGRLPLALRVAAANLSISPHKTLRDYVDGLSGDARLAQLSIDNDHGTNLVAVFELSYQVLSRDVQHVFRHLGLIPGDDFTPGLVAAVVDMSITETEAAFQRLETAHMLEQHQPGRFRFHDLVRLYARRLAETLLTGEEKEAAIGRLVDWYTDRSNPYLAEFHNIVAAAETLAGRRQVANLAVAFGRFGSTGHDLKTSYRCARTILKTAEGHGEITGQVRALNALGTIASESGDRGIAIEYFEDAVNRVHGIDNVSLAGQVVGNLGNARYVNGDYAVAEKHMKRAVEMARVSAGGFFLAMRVGNLGRLYHAMGRHRDALVQLRFALDHERHGAPKVDRADILRALSDLYLDMGSYEESVATARQALEISDKIGATRSSALALRHLGRASHRIGRTHDALGYFERTISIAKKDHRIIIHIETLQDLAELHLDMAPGDVGAANACLDFATKLADTREVSLTKDGNFERVLCRIQIHAGDHDQAVKHGIRACEYYRTQRPNPLSLSRSLDALGEAHSGHGDHDAATTCWTEALDIYTSLDVPDGPRLRERMASGIAVAERSSQDISHQSK